jgi:hypothetical protein
MKNRCVWECGKCDMHRKRQAYAREDLLSDACAGVVVITRFDNQPAKIQATSISKLLFDQA